MADPDEVFCDGFDKYGDPVDDSVSDTNSDANRQTLMMAGEWHSVVTTGGASDIQTAIMRAPLTPHPGASVELNFQLESGDQYIRKFLSGTYAKSTGTWHGLFDLNSTHCVYFISSGSIIATIAVMTTGKVRVYRGGVTGGTMLAESIEAIADGAIKCIAWDMVFHASAGKAKIWIDKKPTTIDLSGVNTGSDINGIGIGGNFVNTVRLDHFNSYFYVADGGELPPLGNPIVETSFADADVSADFSKGQAAIGDLYGYGGTAASPGANQLVLRDVTPNVSGDLHSVCIEPRATSTTAKFKAVLYADSGGAPGALVATGTEVTGCTSGTTLVLPFAAGQAIAAATKYWIGYIANTSISIRVTRDDLLGQRKANTYTSGAPDPAGGMTTGVSSWSIYGLVNNLTTDSRLQVSNNPPSAASRHYNSETSVGDGDNFTFDPLTVSPSAIHAVAYKAFGARPDGGDRGVKIQMQSGAAPIDDGSLGEAAFPVTFGHLASYWVKDPNTTVAFTAGGLNAAEGRYEVSS